MAKGTKLRRYEGISDLGYSFEDLDIISDLDCIIWGRSDFASNHHAGTACLTNHLSQVFIFFLVKMNLLLICTVDIFKHSISGLFYAIVSSLSIFRRRFFSLLINRLLLSHVNPEVEAEAGAEARGGRSAILGAVFGYLVLDAGSKVG